MFNSKLFVLICVLSVFIGYNFNNIYVKEDFHDQFRYKLLFSALKIVADISYYGDIYGVAPEYFTYRYIPDVCTSILASKSDHHITIKNTEFNKVPVRIYEPNIKTDKPQPVMVYFHGGAFFLNTFDSFDDYLVNLVRKTNLTIISVNYRLAPEHPFPIPTQDCWTAVEYVLKNSAKLNINLNKLVLAGDSAGGNAAMVISQKLAREKLTKPILQVLIYPWVQLAFPNLPATYNYKGGILSMSYAKAKLWYLGIKNVTQEMEDAVFSSNHTLLLTEAEKEKFSSIMDINIIPDEYKKNKDYYELYKHLKVIKQGSKLDSSNILIRDKEFAEKVKLLFSEEVSPGLASLESLKLQPKTYQIVCELDGIKDDDLILAERLKKAGVNVKLNFYEQCFHGMIPMTNKYLGFEYSHKILDDLADYLNQNL